MPSNSLPTSSGLVRNGIPSQTGIIRSAMLYRDWQVYHLLSSVFQGGNTVYSVLGLVGVVRRRNLVLLFHLIMIPTILKFPLSFSFALVNPIVVSLMSLRIPGHSFQFFHTTHPPPS